jgi:hypothetical protein
MNRKHLLTRWGRKEKMHKGLSIMLRNAVLVATCHCELGEAISAYTHHANNEIATSLAFLAKTFHSFALSLRA